MSSDTNRQNGEEASSPTHESQEFDWEAIRGRFAQLRQTADRGDDLTDAQAATVLSERAKVLAESVAEIDHSGVLELMVLNLCDERIALETRFIHEVMRVSDITPIPGAPALLIGVTNLRGSVLPVMNLRLAFGIGGEPPEDVVLIVVGGEQPEFGILVDSVHDMQSLRADELLPAPSNLASVQADLCQGVTEQAMVVLRGDALIAHDYFYIGDEGGEAADRGAVS